MMNEKIFTKEESPYHPGKYTIRPDFDKFFLNYTEGSFNIICARLMGLSYADYLRMCRDCFGAEIMGKNSKYPIAYFKRSKELDALIDNLNARANMVMWERSNPNHAEHAKVVQEQNPLFYAEVVNENK